MLSLVFSFMCRLPSVLFALSANSVNCFLLGASLACLGFSLVRAPQRLVWAPQLLVWAPQLLVWALQLLVWAPQLLAWALCSLDLLFLYILYFDFSIKASSGFHFLIVFSIILYND